MLDHIVGRQLWFFASFCFVFSYFSLLVLKLSRNGSERVCIGFCILAFVPILMAICQSLYEVADIIDYYFDVLVPSAGHFIGILRGPLYVLLVGAGQSLLAILVCGFYLVLRGGGTSREK